MNETYGSTVVDYDDSTTDIGLHAAVNWIELYNIFYVYTNSQTSIQPAPVIVHAFVSLVDVTTGCVVTFISTETLRFHGNAP